MPCSHRCDHHDTAVRVTAERALNKHLNGGCQVPIACYAVLEGENLWLRGLVGDPRRHCCSRRSARPAVDARRWASRWPKTLLAKGAGDILKRSTARQATSERLACAAHASC